MNGEIHILTVAQIKLYGGGSLFFRVLGFSGYLFFERSLGDILLILFCENMSVWIA